MGISFFQRLPVRLAGMILLLGLVAVPAVSELKRRSIERMVLQQAEVQAATATIAVAESLSEGLRTVETTARYLGRDLEDRPLAAPEIDRILHNVLTGAKSVRDCSISLEPGVLGAGTEHFGHYLRRSGDRLITADLATSDNHYWTRDWYNDAIGRGDLVWSEPFLDEAGGGSYVVRASIPFFRITDGHRAVAGVVSVGIDLDWVKRVTTENDFFDTGYVIIFSQKGDLISFPDRHYEFKETMESLAQKLNNPELATIFQRISARRQGSVSYLSNAFHHRVHENYKPVASAGWGVVVGYDEAEFLAHVSAFRWATFVSLASTMALLVVIVLVVTALALRPLGRLTQVAVDISKGNLDTKIAPPRRKDEVGTLTGSFEVMREALKRNAELEAQVRRHVDELSVANEKLASENLERRWANQALEHQRHYDQLIINSISDMVFVLTKALNISRINPAVVRGTGWEAQDLVNLPLSRVVTLVAEDGTVPLVDPMVQSLNEGRDLRDRAAFIEDKRGGRQPVRFTLFPLRDKDKVVGGVALLQSDPGRRESPSTAAPSSPPT